MEVNRDGVFNARKPVTRRIRWRCRDILVYSKFLRSFRFFFQKSWVCLGNPHGRYWYRLGRGAETSSVGIGEGEYEFSVFGGKFYISSKSPYAAISSWIIKNFFDSTATDQQFEYIPPSRHNQLVDLAFG